MAAMFVGNGPAAAGQAPIVKAPAATQAALAALRRILIPGPFLLTAPGAPFGWQGGGANTLRRGGPRRAAQTLAAGDANAAASAWRGHRHRAGARPGSALG